jgi:alpha-beta hydrolase superfamily lysophospholipase
VSLIILHGTDDKLIAHSGSEQFVANAPKNLITFKSLPGFYHEVHNEPAAEREKVFVEIINWLNSKV